MAPANVSISEAESAVMEVVWRRGTATSEEVINDLKGRMQWQEATVKTLLNRLLKKGAVSARKEGRRFLYQPLLSRATWLGRESEGFIDRLFNGQLAPLVLHFSAQRKLGKKDIAELKRLVDELGNE